MVAVSLYRSQCCISHAKGPGLRFRDFHGKSKDGAGESPEVCLVYLPSKKGMFYDDRDRQLEQNNRAEQWQCEQVAAKREAWQQGIRGLDELLLTLEQGGVGYI